MGIIVHEVRSLVWYSICCAIAIVVCSAQICCSQDSDSVVYTYAWSIDNEDVGYEESFPGVFTVRALAYAADVVFSRTELVYLLGFDTGAVVRHAQLDRAMIRLRQKRKFSSIVITVIVQPVDKSCVVQVDFCSFWSFARVTCKGVLVGRDRYKHLYLLESGERFDNDKHRDSIERIKDACRQEGYLCPVIIDNLVYDEPTKMVAATLDLRLGKQFVVGSVSLACTVQPLDDMPLIHKQLYRFLLRELRGAYYSQGALESAIHQAEERCFEKGFLQVVFNHSLVIDEQRGLVDIHFTSELGERKTFEFFGNHFFPDRQLLDYIMKFGKSALFLPPSLLVEDLIELYKNHGFWDVAISFEEEKNRCFFCIAEKKRAHIERATVVGGSYFPESFFNSCYSGLVHGKGFDQKICTRVRNKIMQAYVSAGFWDCSIGQEDFSVLSNGRYELTVAVQEGQQKLLRSVTVEGFEQLNKESVFASCEHLKDPIPFDIQLVQDQRRFLLRYLQDSGYLFANPKPELIEGDGCIDLVWHIEGDVQRVSFGTTILAGSSRLSAAIITRELAYESGQPWEQAKIDRSLERLKALKIFESISWYPVDDARDTKNYKDLVLDYLEDDPFELQVRAGTQFVGRNLRFRDLSFRAGGAFLWKNPTNSGDHFAFNADVTGYTRNVVGCYQQPWTFDLPIETKLKAYSIRFDQPAAQCSRERLYRLGQDGFLMSCMHRSGDSQVGIGCGVEWMELKHLSRVTAQVIDFAPRLIDQKVPYFFAEPTALISFLDDAAYPTVGSVSLLSCKVMVPLDKIETSFVKFLAEQQLFVPFFGSSVLAFRLRAGHMFNQCFSQIMPSERFYLGGSYSLRAYEADLAPPVNTLMGCDGLPCLVPIGGRSVVNGTAELRYGLFDNFGVVLFTDCGVLAQNDIKAICMDSFLGATGFGLRYATPVGPIRFDIGWKWCSLKEERRSYAWFLTLGQAF